MRPRPAPSNRVSARQAGGTGALMTPDIPPDLVAPLAAGGETGRLIATHDWSTTALGPMVTWPGRLRAAVATILRCPEAMHISWGPDLLQFYNDAYRPVLGSTKHPAIGVPLRDTFPEAFDSFIAPRFSVALEEGRSYVADSELFPVERHGWLEETHFGFSYNPIDGDDGTVAGVFTVCSETTRDVVSRRRLELLASCTAALALPDDEPGLLAALVSHLSQCVDTAGVAVVDADGTVLTAEGFVDLGRGATLDPAMLGAPDDRGRVLLSDLGVAARRHTDWTAPADHAWVGDVGDRRLVVALHPGLWFDADYRRFLSLVLEAVRAGRARVARAAQTREHLASLREMDRLKDALLSDVSHELRTPLMLIAGTHEQLMHRTDLDDDAREMLWATATRSVERLRRQVDSLLSYGRLSAGHLVAHPADVDLAVLTTEVCEQFEAEFGRVGLGFTVDVPREPLVARVDPAMWETALSNLLSNAHRFTLQGEVIVRVDRVDDEAIIEVTDTGVGIPEAEIPRLFDRFHRIRGQPARTEEGAGIGLALVAGILEQHGAEIEVESRSGHGTTFRVRLPVLDGVGTSALAASRRTVSADGSREAGPFPAGRVLVVEDNDRLRQLLEVALKPHWDVTVAVHGQDALQQLDTARPDLVITDAMMPVLDGPRLVQALRADPVTAAVPIILLTGRGEDGAAGADLVLQKPVRLADLVQAVANLLAASS